MTRQETLKSKGKKTLLTKGLPRVLWSYCYVQGTSSRLTYSRTRMLLKRGTGNDQHVEVKNK